ncbi:AAA family ATPase [bacterium]|nr:AAA family ATPase [bacterium]
MIFLRQIKYQAPVNTTVFPFSLPVLQQFTTLSFTKSITLLVGENGSGKSTLLEGLAASIPSITVGEDSIDHDPTLQHARELGKYFQLTWQEKTRKGFFMRAEDFFQYSKKMNTLRQEMEDSLHETEEAFKDRSPTARVYARSGYANSLYAIESRYGKDMDAHSHGEGFIEFFQSRIVPKGLYLIDEPEAPLSPISQLSFMMMLQNLEQENQFIIATHSPILMAIPNATIYLFEQEVIQEVSYDQIPSVQFMKKFLQYPELFIQHLDNP